MGDRSRSDDVRPSSFAKAPNPRMATREIRKPSNYRPFVSGSRWQSINSFLLFQGVLLLDVRNHADVERVLLRVLRHMRGHVVHPNGRHEAQVQEQTLRGVGRPEGPGGSAAPAAFVGQGESSSLQRLLHLRSRYRLPRKARTVRLPVLLVPARNSHQLLPTHRGR